MVMPGGAAARAGAARARKKRAAAASKRRQETAVRFVESQKKTNEWLEKFDSDKSGTLDKDQLRNCMTSLVPEGGAPPTESEVDEVFYQADRDHNGMLEPLEVSMAVSVWLSMLKEKKFVREVFDK